MIFLALRSENTSTKAVNRWWTSSGLGKVDKVSGSSVTDHERPDTTSFEPVEVVQDVSQVVEHDGSSLPVATPDTISSICMSTCCAR